MNKNPKQYTPNNIVFRISSAKMLERFKATQGFVLTEMEYGQYKFSRTSKEVALLYCDTTFRALMAIEKRIVKAKEDIVTVPFASDIMSVLIEGIGYVQAVTDANPKVFSREYVDIWREVHLPLSKIIERVIEENVGNDMSLFFVSMATILIDSIDSIRFELYEIDYILSGGKNPFLVIKNELIEILKH